MLGDLIRVKLDESNNELVVELKDGTISKSMTMPEARGRPRLRLDLDAERYVLAVRIDGLKDVLGL